MKNTTHPAAAGTQCPDLEGAPRSLSHAPRNISVISAPQTPPPAGPAGGPAKEGQP